MGREHFFLHPQGICETDKVGEGTRIWAYAHVLPGAVLGAECNICDHVFIENDVIVGDRVTVKSGVQLWDGIRLEDDVFIGPNVTFTNDPFPRSKKHLEKYQITTVRKGASIGGNATILPGITIGSMAMVGAGAVVTTDVPPNAIVYDNPAIIKGYTDIKVKDNYKISSFVVSQTSFVESENNVLDLNVRGCKLVKLPTFSDIRGKLMVAEFSSNLPFAPRRVFFVHGIPNDKVRGEHAHKICSQFLVAVHGRLSVVVDDGRTREEVLLDDSGIGILIPPVVWGIQYRFSPDAVLAVFASHAYDNEDYIRDYDEFSSLVRAAAGPD